jgi:hypothetical protein
LKIAALDLRRYAGQAYDYRIPNMIRRPPAGQKSLKSVFQIDYKEKVKLHIFMKKDGNEFDYPNDIVTIF